MRRGDDLARGRQDVRRLIASTLDLDGGAAARLIGPRSSSPPTQQAAPRGGPFSFAALIQIKPPRWLSALGLVCMTDVVDMERFKVLAQHCESVADVCRQLADRATGPIKAEWLRLAVKWLEVAAEADARSRPLM